MNRVTTPVRLQNQNARTSEIARILFRDAGGLDVLEDICDHNTIGGQLVIAAGANLVLVERRRVLGRPALALDSVLGSQTGARPGSTRRQIVPQPALTAV
jgi:hypothetical protein